jgi:hypothetical protein
VEPSSHLFAKRPSDRWPLLKRAIGEGFNNRNTKGRLEIANHLVKNGADLNDLSPWGYPPLTILLNEHYNLRTSKAKYDVFILTLTFALEMVRQDSLDVNCYKKETSGILNAAIEVWEYHTRAENQKLEKIARTVVKELLDRGAKSRLPSVSSSMSIQDSKRRRLVIKGELARATTSLTPKGQLAAKRSLTRSSCGALASGPH